MLACVLIPLKEKNKKSPNTFSLHKLVSQIARLLGESTFNWENRDIFLSLPMSSLSEFLAVTKIWDLSLS